MNREEMVIHLMRNPNDKFRMIRDEFGDSYRLNVIVRLNRNGQIVRGNDGDVFEIYFKDDKSEFELIRELKEMIFAEAVELTREDRQITIVSTETGEGYTGETRIYLISASEIQGLWTVEGVYE